MARGYKLLTPAEARALNPALRGEFTAALHCERDAAVEPRTAQLALCSGVRAGAGAGVRTGAHDADALRAAGATHVLDSVGQLPGALA